MTTTTSALRALGRGWVEAAIALGEAVGSGDAQARADVTQLLGATEPALQARGWFALLTAARSAPALAVEIHDQHRGRELPKPLAIGVQAAFGPLVSRFRPAAAKDGNAADLLTAARDAFVKATTDGERLTIVEGAAKVLANRAASDSAAASALPAEASLRDLALGGRAEQMFLCQLTVALGRRVPDLVTAAPELARRLHQAVHMALEVGDMSVLVAALEALACVWSEELAAAWKPVATKAKDATKKAKEAKPSAEPSETGVENPDEDASLEVFRTVEGRRDRYVRIASAIAGRAKERDEVFVNMRDERQQAFARGTFLRALPAILRHAPPAERAAAARHAGEALTAVGRTAQGLSAGCDKARMGNDLLRQNLALVATELLGEPTVASAAEEAIRDSFEVSRHSLVVGFEEGANEARATRSAVAAMGRVCGRRAPGGGDDPQRETLLRDLREVARLDADEARWGRPSACEAAFAGLPDLLAGSPGTTWKEPFFEALLSCVATPPADDDLFGACRFLGAWEAFNEILERTRVGLKEALQGLALVALGEDVATATPPRIDVTAVLAGVLATPSASLLGSLTRPPVQLLVEATWPSVGADARATRGLVSAITWESRFVRTLARRFDGWASLSASDRLWLTLSLAALLRSPITRFVERIDLKRLPATLAEELGATLAHLEPDAAGGRDRGGHLREVARSLPREVFEALSEEMERLTDHPALQAPNRGDGLPQVILAMVDERNSYHLCGLLSRHVVRHVWRHRDDAGFDLAVPLFQLALQEPHPDLFAHVAARLKRRDESPERQGDHDLAHVIYQHAKSVRMSRDRDDPWPKSAEAILREAEEFRSHRSRLASPLYDRAVQALEMLARLAGASPDVWAALRGEPPSDQSCPDEAHHGKAGPEEGPPGGLGQLLAALDRLADTCGRPLGLAMRHEAQLVEFHESLEYYCNLPVNQFDERRTQLGEMVTGLDALRTGLLGLAGSKSLLGSLVKLLLEHLCKFLDRVEKEHVKRAEELRHEGNYREFFAVYLAGPHDANWPALPPGQLAAYDEFYVDWVAGELDVAALSETLHPRWSRPFRFLYAAVTNVWVVLAVVAAPFALLALLSHSPPRSTGHALQGVGLAAYTALLFGGLLVMLASVTFRLLRRAAVGRRPKESEQAGHQFKCFLPRLVGLIVGPMVLLVDFDHSYHFPINASGVIIVLLLVMTLLSTAFYIGLQLGGDRATAPGSTTHRASGQPLFLRIMGLALFEAFVAAILFSTLFGSNYFAHQPDVVAHARPFLGVIPKVVYVNLGALVGHGVAHAAPHGGAGHVSSGLVMTFYPTIILVWTALGLFLGMFLEGFFRGKMLRGGKHEEAEEE